MKAFAHIISGIQQEMGKDFKPNRQVAQPIHFVNFSHKEAVSKNQTRNDIATNNSFIAVFPWLSYGDGPRSVGVMIMPLLLLELSAKVFAGFNYGAVNNSDAEKLVKRPREPKQKDTQLHQTVDIHTGTTITQGLERSSLILFALGIDISDKETASYCFLFIGRSII
jgi:hypothetical protein